MDNQFFDNLHREVRNCCRDGGASIFADGSVYPAKSSKDILERSSGGNWEYRVLYVSSPNITVDELRNRFLLSIKRT